MNRPIIVLVDYIDTISDMRPRPAVARVGTHPHRSSGTHPHLLCSLKGVGGAGLHKRAPPLALALAAAAGAAVATAP